MTKVKLTEEELYKALVDVIVRTTYNNPTSIAEGARLMMLDPKFREAFGLEDAAKISTKA